MRYSPAVDTGVIIYKNTYMALSARELFEGADEIRMDDPVLWAIIRGRSNIGKVVTLSGQSPRQVVERAEVLISMGVIYQNSKIETPAYYLNQRYSRYSEFKQYRALYEAIELKGLEVGDLNPTQEKGLVSSSTMNKWKEANPEKAVRRSQTERFDDTLTMKQAGVLMAIGRTWANGKTFRPLELARAQGYSQGGYAKQNIEVLVSKGFVEKVEGTSYQITEAGVEKYKAAKAAGVPVAERERVTFDL